MLVEKLDLFYEESEFGAQRDGCHIKTTRENLEYIELRVSLIHSKEFKEGLRFV